MVFWAVLDIPTTPIQVKSEPLEVALGIDSEESLAPAEPEDVLDHEQMEVTSQDSGDADEQVANVVGGLFLRSPGQNENWL